MADQTANDADKTPTAPTNATPDAAPTAKPKGQDDVPQILKDLAFEAGVESGGSAA